jgi:hypothetical protein
VPELVGAGDFSTRQKFVNLVPALVAIGIVGVLVMAGAPEKAPDVHRLMRRVEDYGWVGAAYLTSGSVLLALLLEPLELASIRLLEGYGSMRGVFGSLRVSGRWIQRRRRDRLSWIEQHGDIDDQERAARELSRLPDPNRMLPTLLGNRLRSMEQRAGLPYELNGILTWPRLYQTLPEGAMKVVADGRNQLDTAARLCLSLALAAVVSSGLLITHEWWLLAPAAMLLMSWLAYGAAVAAAGVYTTAVFAAFDLHRLKMVQAMRIDVPAGLLAERKLNRKLMTLWDRGNRLSKDIAYSPTETDYGLYHK